MEDRVEGLESARVAFQQRDWATARRAFKQAADDGDLAADDLAALANASWWLGEIDETNRLFEEAHRRYLEQGRRAEGCLAAMEIAINHFLRGEQVLASGWMARATRLAAELPEGPVHGYLSYALDVDSSFGGRDFDKALTAARRVQELGRRYGDAQLIAIGLLGEGRILIKHGSPAAGLALLDEAMVAILAGEIGPDWAGNIYCNTISACHELADYGRMRQWTEATERWLTTLSGAVLFSGICRVHRVQLLILEGELERAASDAIRVCDELAEISVANAAEAWYQLGEARRLGGDHDGAEGAYTAAHQRGRDPQPGLALLRLAQGRSKAALSSVRSALIAKPGQPLARVPLLAAQHEIALASGDLATAREACSELRATAATYGTPGLEALTAVASGALALAEGQVEEALVALRDGCRGWRELKAPYHVARACLLLARSYRELRDEDAAAMEDAAADELLGELGIARSVLVAGLAAGPAARPAGLSAREVEVVALVAAGLTNPAIAAQLGISPRTVARHLANIFVKLGAASRTEAARQAFELGLAPAARRQEP